MSKGRLTRNELSWLLTQEAQNAAERLRAGVQLLRTKAEPQKTSDDTAHGVDSSLDALDDVMRMLSSLNQRSAPQSGSMPAARRGRIDLAALLVEVAPAARVSIEPGSGTEVYGEEADLRRLLQVLIGHGGGEGAAVVVRRDGDDVKVSVALGPDTSPTAETERAWLTRMAMRYGGSYELEGGGETLVLPAEGATERSESAALRKELDEARKQGEVYARELAAMFDRGEELKTISTFPPASFGSTEVRFAAVAKLCAGIASELAHAHAADVAKSLRTVGELRAEELSADVDLADVARTAVTELAPLAEREGVRVQLRVDAPGGRVHVRRGARALAVLARQLVTHAVEASPRGAEVHIVVSGGEGGSWARLAVDDAGPALPASSRRAYLTLDTNAGAFGRPSALPLFLASELSACLGASLDVSDAPKTSGEAVPSGLRVTVHFGKAS